MGLLSLDTSSVNCAVHLTRQDGVVYQRTDQIGRGHAEHLIDMIDEALSCLSMSYSDLKKIGVTTGPGSFAGIRIGLAAARGLSLALDIPVVGVSVLEALAKECLDEGAVLVVLDARRDEYYTALFDPARCLLGKPMLYRAGEPYPAAWREVVRLNLVGSGAQTLCADFSHAFLRSQAALPQIETVARLCAAARPHDKKPKPLYIRPPDAKPAALQGRIVRVDS